MVDNNSPKQTNLDYKNFIYLIMKSKYLIVILFLFSCYSGLSQNKDITASLNSYKDKVLLLFYKCSSLDNEITKAIAVKNTTDIESGRVALLQCATTGIKELNAIESFNGDPSLKFSCRDALKFYQQLAESDIPVVRDFFIQEESFLKEKKLFERKPLKKYSQAQITEFNARIKKYNAGVTQYTLFTDFINKSRKQILYNWNASVKLFTDEHLRKV